jgi:hypothetical protein
VIGEFRFTLGAPRCEVSASTWQLSVKRPSIPSSKKGEDKGILEVAPGSRKSIRPKEQNGEWRLLTNRRIDTPLAEDQ